MRELVLIAVLLAGFGSNANGQTTDMSGCPKITVTGPAGVIQPGDTFSFVATISGPLPKDVGYKWTISKGEIIRGHGTAHIDVRYIGEVGISLTATVEVSGLPGGCGKRVSETLVQDPPPVPLQLDEFAGWKQSASNGRYHAIVEELEKNQTSQAYLIFSHRFDIEGDEAESRERIVLRKLIDSGIDPTRITAIRRTDEKETVQIWRVPPGAENPTCDDCENVYKCPEISLAGPPGITLPGDSMEYKAQISGNVPDRVRYEWTVSEGEIIEGQGTLAIKVRSPEQDLISLTATIRVLGLPGGCAFTANETAPVAVISDHILVDEFVSEGLQLEKGRLVTAASTLKERPDDILYFIEYFPPNTSGFDIREKQRNITEFLRKYAKLNENNFKIVTAKGPEFRTRIYRIPPGSEFPVP